MGQNNSLKIAIDARCTPGKGGGVSTAVLSLIHTLGKLEGPEAYTLAIESEEQLERLHPWSGSNQRFAIKPGPSSKPKGRLGLPQRAIGYAQKLIGVNGSQRKPELPVSDGFYESLDCDLIHFPTQKFVLCGLISIYNPHDLQHLHHPQFFTPSEIAKRETLYQAGCHFARTIVVGSQWVKDDVVNQYRVNPDKVQVVPEHPPTQLSPEIPSEYVSEVKDSYQLQQPFAVYPAVTWPHKNHLRLFKALAFLRDKRGLTIRLVCTGSRYEPHWPRIEECINELKLHDQVKFAGFVPELDLRVIYRLAKFLVMPTLFEASSLPIFEAWLEGTPVACSDATALPGQVMDAALLFDPTDTISIADAVARIATDDTLRDQLRSRGYRRLQDFDWERTAKAYRAVYRRAGGHHLSEEDRWLLSWDWMRNPERKMEVA